MGPLLKGPRYMLCISIEEHVYQSPQTMLLDVRFYFETLNYGILLTISTV